jgi:hypothetical protein
VAKLTSTGGYIWSETFGDWDAISQTTSSLAVDSTGNIVLTGYFNGELDFGTGYLVSDGADYDIFLVKLAP